MRYRYEIREFDGKFVRKVEFYFELDSFEFSNFIESKITDKFSAEREWDGRFSLQYGNYYKNAQFIDERLMDEIQKTIDAVELATQSKSPN